MTPRRWIVRLLARLLGAPRPRLLEPLGTLERESEFYPEVL